MDAWHGQGSVSCCTRGLEGWVLHVTRRVAMEENQQNLKENVLLRFRNLNCL